MIKKKVLHAPKKKGGNRKAIKVRNKSRRIKYRGGRNNGLSRWLSVLYSDTGAVTSRGQRCVQSRAFRIETRRIDTWARIVLQWDWLTSGCLLLRGGWGWWWHIRAGFPSTGGKYPVTTADRDFSSWKGFKISRGFNLPSREAGGGTSSRNTQ